MTLDPRHRAAVEVVVPFFHVDPANVVWHGHYPEYLEAARCRLMEQIGYSYEEMAASGYLWPVVDLRIKYVRPLRYGQRLEVEAWVAEWEYRLKIAYAIRAAGNDAVLTRAHTIQVAVDAHSGQMCYETPPVLRRALGVE